MPIGQAERQTQQRVIQLFQKTLAYQYLGHWQDRPDNRNIETELLEAFLTEQGHSAALIQRTLHLLNCAANDQTQGLYACNKAVYGLLRYACRSKPMPVSRRKRSFSSTGNTRSATISALPKR